MSLLVQASQILRDHCARHCAMGLTHCGFALAGPGPGRGQSDAMAGLLLLAPGGKSLLYFASMDLCLCTLASYRSSE